MNTSLMLASIWKTIKGKLAWFHGVRLEVFTDGSFKNGRGSWAYVIVNRGVVLQENSGLARKTNSLRMELRAGIEALGALRVMNRAGTAIVFSDSRTVVDAMKAGRDVLQVRPNADLLNELLALSRVSNVEWRWIKAHSGHVYNERCDQLCVLARSISLKEIQ